MPPIVRLTLFKLPDATAVQETVKRYSTLSQDAIKSHTNTPYIRSASASTPYQDPRNQGITLVARTEFASKADMDYFDNECAAHGRIKAAIKEKVLEPPVVLYMDA
ncbi:hypothetical protein BDV95DRAFT_487423 [Massariosphaeria phaeospora]|uniref:Stress-response A/B barrel domain-containing protein n=1 Tax=Massariosphaeria phaeospora TaxID=100035 RepID=A0A7C8IAB5_9PLEO|nr:hypothetical protein BDV95DRAFT_487423 [Massariosphaeria phaeospora]